MVEPKPNFMDKIDLNYSKGEFLNNDHDVKNFTLEGIISMLGVVLSSKLNYLSKKVEDLGEYRSASKFEILEYVSRMLEFIDDPKLQRNKVENLTAWNNGWQENLDLIKTQGFSEFTTKPKYFRKHKFLRFKNDLIIPSNSNLEYDLFRIIKETIFQEFLLPFNEIHELGCGSGGNLWTLAKLFPHKSLIGYDWAEPSVKIASLMGKCLKRGIIGKRIDFLDNNLSFEFSQSSAVVSIHAIEQIGKSHTNLLEAILKAKPSIVVHFEPILEFYDSYQCLDNLALKYSKRRNYLEDFFSSLKSYEKKGVLKIKHAQRPRIGGVWHESSLVVWEPCLT